jgi:hypothetical protein
MLTYADTTQELLRRKGKGLSNVAKLKAFYKVHAPFKAAQADSIIRKFSDLTELNKVLRVQVMTRRMLK